MMLVSQTTTAHCPLSTLAAEFIPLADVSHAPGSVSNQEWEGLHKSTVLVDPTATIGE